MVKGQVDPESSYYLMKCECMCLMPKEIISDKN